MDSAQQIAAIRRDVAEIKRGRVTHRTVTVTASDPVTSKFSADLPDGQPLTGLSAPAEFLPAAGQDVTLRLEGATPLYEPAGIAGMSAGKLTSGAMTADVTLSGRFATALTGTRVELNALGLQKWDASNNLMVSITGSQNLMTGTYQTALTGRRIVTGASGNVGRVSFIAPNGVTGLVESFTSAESGDEATRLILPITTGTYWEGWNGVQFQTNERSLMSSGLMQFYYGGGGAGSQQFQVFEAANRGTGAATLPTSTLRLDIDPGHSSMVGPDGITGFDAQINALRMYVGDTVFEGSIDVVQHGIPDTDLRSPRMIFRSEPDGVGGVTYAAGLRFAVGPGGAGPRLAVTNTADTGYGPIWASEFVVSSTEVTKGEIDDLQGSPLAVVDAMRPRTYRRIADPGVQRDPDDTPEEPPPAELGPVEIGLVAEESPAEVLAPSGDAVNLYALGVITAASVQELAAMVRALDDRIGKLETDGSQP